MTGEGKRQSNKHKEEPPAVGRRRHRSSESAEKGGREKEKEGARKMERGVVGRKRDRTEEGRSLLIEHIQRSKYSWPYSRLISAVRLFHKDVSFLVVKSFHIIVLNAVGSIIDTLTPNISISRRSASENASMPYFEMAYGARPAAQYRPRKSTMTDSCQFFVFF